MGAIYVSAAGERIGLSQNTNIYSASGDSFALDKFEGGVFLFLSEALAPKSRNDHSGMIGDPRFYLAMHPPLLGNRVIGKEAIFERDCDAAIGSKGQHKCGAKRQ